MVVDISSESTARNAAFTAPLDGGDVVDVRYIGQDEVSSDHIRGLILRADRGLVSLNPTVPINGTMQTGDRIAVTDNLLLWFDCTREAGFWSGGGGLLRGAWRLHRDETGALDFLYVVNEDGWAPNNLLPGHMARNGNGRGDAWQILCVTEFGDDPENTFRATSTETTTIEDDGSYDSHSEVLSYVFSGVLTTGNGTVEYPWGTNIGEPSAPAQLSYQASYKVYNSKQGADGFRVDASFTVAVSDDAEFHPTASLKSMVFSLGLSRDDISEQIRLDWVKSDVQDMIRGRWFVDADGTWYNNHKDKAVAGTDRYVPSPYGEEPSKYNFGTVYHNENEVLDTKYYTDPSSTFGDGLRLRLVSKMSAVGLQIYELGAYFQFLYDLPNFNFTQDQKIGDNNQAGIIGVMQKGWSVTCTNTMFFDYDE